MRDLLKALIIFTMIVLLYVCLLGVTGCGASAGEIRSPDGWHTRFAEAHLLADPSIAKLELPPGVKVEGFKSDVVVAAVKDLAGGVLQAIVRIFKP